MARLDFIKFALKFGYIKDAERFISELKILHPDKLKLSKDYGAGA